MSCAFKFLNCIGKFYGIIKPKIPMSPQYPETGYFFLFSVITFRVNGNPLKIKRTGISKQSLQTAKTLLPTFAILAFMALMLVNPSYYLKSATKGLALFATAVLPSLFPFYFFSMLLTKIGGAKTLSALGAKPMRFLYNAPPCAAYVVTLSFMSGYPVGASMISELYKTGIIDTSQAKCMLSYASTSGPVFIMGTVGAALFEDWRVGAVALAAHYLGALLNGLVYRARAVDGSKTPSVTALNTDLDSALASSITNSTMSMLAVGGYIVLAGLLIDTLELLSLSERITSAISGDGGAALSSIIYGFFEMTRGAQAATLIQNKQLACAIASAAVSFGGISVLLQTQTFMSVCSVRFRDTAIRKLTQCIITFALAYLIGFAF